MICYSQDKFGRPSHSHNMNKNLQNQGTEEKSSEKQSSDEEEGNNSVREDPKVVRLSF